MLKVITKSLGLGLASCLVAAQTTLAASYLVGFQTYTNCTAGNNNSGICDSAPQSNSTYDADPVGNIGPGNLYLTATIGPEASSLGRKGWGQQTNNAFLNGEGFGNEVGNPERFIVNVPNASDGTLPGIRHGAYDTTPQGAPNGTSSWKFGNSGNQRLGDVRITNHSDYYFKLTFLNFDARVGNANSPHNLQIKYLNGDGTAYDNGLLKKSTGAEINNLTSVYNNDFGTEPNTYNVSRSLGEAVDSQVYLPPNSSAAFRLFWTDQATEGSQSQIDNFAFQGTFYWTENLEIEVDPVTWSSSSVPGPGASLGWLLGSLLMGLGVWKARRRA